MENLSILELYTDLAKSLLEKSIDESLILQIVKSNEDPNQVVAFLIELYSKYAISGNIQFISSIYYKLTSLSQFTKKKLKNNGGVEFSNLLAEVLKIFVKIKPRDRDISNKLGYVVTINEIETLVQNLDIHRCDIYDSEFSVCKKLMENDMISYDLYKVLNALIDNIVGEKNKKNVLSIVSYLCNVKPAPVVGMIEFAEISPFKIGIKKDIIWVLWCLSLNIAKSKSKTHYDFTLYNFNIYCTSFQKKYKETRFNILIFVYSILASSDPEKYIVENNQSKHHHLNKHDKSSAIDTGIYFIITHLDKSLQSRLESERLNYTDTLEKKSIPPKIMDLSADSSHQKESRNL